MKNSWAWLPILVLAAFMGVFAWTVVAVNSQLGIAESKLNRINDAWTARFANEVSLAKMSFSKRVSLYRTEIESVEDSACAQIGLMRSTWQADRSNVAARIEALLARIED